MGATVRTSALETLHDLFPSLDRVILSDVLHESGDDLEKSAAALADMLPGVAPLISKAQVRLPEARGTSNSSALLQSPLCYQ